MVGIARGALPFLRREFDGFRFRLAHEYAHLAVGDPRREEWLLVIYGVTAIFLLISYGASLLNELTVLVSIGAVGGWVAVTRAIFGWMRFGFIANIVLFVSIFVVLMLERRSAARLREFHADAVATAVVGPVQRAFGEAEPTRRGFRKLISSWFASHPGSDVRVGAIGDRQVVYRADVILFALHGFFIAFILEIILQLMFTSASAGLASYGDRRASLWRYLEVNGLIAGGVILFGALLAATAVFLVLSRLVATSALFHEARQRVRLIASILSFTLAGVVSLLLTSQSTLWDLEQVGWSPMRYAAVCWDRLAMHGVVFVSLSIVTLLVFVLRPRRTFAVAAWACFPVAAALGLGFMIYG